MRIDITRPTTRSLVFLAAISLAAASCGDPKDSASTQPNATDPAETTSAVTTTTVTATTTPTPTTTTEPPEPTTTLAPTQSQLIWGIPNGLKVAVAGADGLHLLTGIDDRILSPEAFDDVVADPSGDGWFVQDFVEFNDSAAPRTIRRIGNDGSEEIILTAEAGTYLSMHDAGVVDGNTTLFYSVNLIREDPQFEILDQLFAMDLVTGVQTKLADVGGWEAGVSVKYGDGLLVGIWTSEVVVRPWSVDLAGNLQPLDVAQAGLQLEYVDDPAAPVALTTSAGGSRLAWMTRDFPFDSSVASQHLFISSTEDAGRLEFTLPIGPTQVNDLVDHGDYLVLAGGQTPSTLVDAETGGMLTLPIVGPAAAAGEWVESPRWAIPTALATDVTDEIRALDPQWETAEEPDAALAELLLGDDGGGECASIVRSFPENSFGDGPFYIELRQFCDDSVAGALYEVTLPWDVGGATRRNLCTRGTTADGLCV